MTFVLIWEMIGLDKLAIEELVLATVVYLLCLETYASGDSVLRHRHLTEKMDSKRIQRRTFLSMYQKFGEVVH